MDNQDSPLNFQIFRETTYNPFKSEKRKNFQNKWRNDDFEIFLDDVIYLKNKKGWFFFILKILFKSFKEILFTIQQKSNKKSKKFFLNKFC